MEIQQRKNYSEACLQIEKNQIWKYILLNIYPGATALFQEEKKQKDINKNNSLKTQAQVKINNLLSSSPTSEISEIEIQSQFKQLILSDMSSEQKFQQGVQNFESLQKTYQQIEIISTIEPHRLGTPSFQQLPLKQDFCFTLYQMMLKILNKDFTSHEIEVYQCKGQDQSTSASFNIIIFYILVQIDNVSLKEQVRELQKLDQLKDQVLATTTHDLKTPLNAIMCMIDESMLCIEKSQSVEYLNYALCNCEMLLSLVGDILDFSQLKEKRLKINISSCNIRQELEQVLAIMNVQTRLKNINLVFINNINSKEEQFFTDPKRLKQVLINLIGNSLKFTNSGKIIVSVNKLPEGFIRIEIIDTGTGIKEEVIPKLCNLYATFGNEKYQNSSGIGLGLNICKQLVGELGPFAKLYISSIYGEGAKFGFLLMDKKNQDSLVNKQFEDYFEPYKLPNQKAKYSIEVDEFQESIEIPSWQINLYQARQPSIKIKHNSFVSSMSVRVLIADDNLFNILVLKNQLKKINQLQIQVTEAYDGEMALNLFKDKNIKRNSEKFSIIFMDCNMPIMDGFCSTFQIKKLIKETSSYEGTAIIALTAQYSLDDKQKFVDCGFNEILVKPVSLKDLVEIVMKNLSNN